MPPYAVAELFRDDDVDLTSIILEYLLPPYAVAELFRDLMFIL